jgi:hypothetical protein
MKKATQFINPFTDFGFKKLFGEEENKDLPRFNKTIPELLTLQDDWLYILKNLPDLKEVPERFRKGVLAKVFKVADMANLSREERRAYEESVKQYRDLKNVTDTAFYDGETKSNVKVILNGHKTGLSAEILAALTELPVKQVLEIIQKGHEH